MSERREREKKKTSRSFDMRVKVSIFHWLIRKIIHLIMAKKVKWITNDAKNAWSEVEMVMAVVAVGEMRASGNDEKQHERCSDLTIYYAQILWWYNNHRVVCCVLDILMVSIVQVPMAHWYISIMDFVWYSKWICSSRKWMTKERKREWVGRGGRTTR